MSHGCHDCHCPNGCRCDELAEARKLREQIGDEAYEALVALGKAEAERNRLEWVLRQAEDEVFEKADIVKGLCEDVDLQGIYKSVKVGTDIHRALWLATRRT